MAGRLTAERIGPYLESAAGDLATALHLYDWNSAVAGAMHADLGRLEVIVRNAFDAALNGHADHLGAGGSGAAVRQVEDRCCVWDVHRRMPSAVGTQAAAGGL